MCAIFTGRFEGIMIDVILYENGEAHLGCELAIRYRLYVPGWRLRGILSCVIRDRTVGTVVALGF